MSSTAGNSENLRGLTTNVGVRRSMQQRRNLLTQMTPTIQEILFRGTFPVYSYMTTLRPFMRMNGVNPREIERFMRAVAGAKLSVREIELLAHGYFRGRQTRHPHVFPSRSHRQAQTAD